MCVLNSVHLKHNMVFVLQALNSFFFFGGVRTRSTLKTKPKEKKSNRCSMNSVVFIYFFSYFNFNSFHMPSPPLNNSHYFPISNHKFPYCIRMKKKHVIGAKQHFLTYFFFINFLCETLSLEWTGYRALIELDKTE